MNEKEFIEDVRKFERHEDNGTWTEVHLAELRGGDTFRAFDGDNVIVEHECGETTFVAAGDPYFGDDGRLVIEMANVPEHEVNTDE